jgi:hypothetical protein
MEDMMRWVTGPAAAVIVLAAAACGGGGTAAASPPPAAKVVSDLDAAIQHASSVHVEGTAPDGGKHVRIDLSMSRSGGLSGQLSVGGAALEVLSTHGSTYIKVTGSFLAYAHLPGSACAIVCGKYLKVSAAQSSGVVGGLTMPAFMAALTKGNPHFRYAGLATVNGQRAWVLRSHTSGQAYVAAEGPAYLLRAVAPPGKSGRLDFTEWNRATIPPPPPASQVVNLSQLQG